MFCVVYSSIFLDNKNNYLYHDNGVIIMMICLTKKSHSSSKYHIVQKFCGTKFSRKLSFKIRFLHFIFHEIQADDQKITLNMNFHDYIFVARKFS